MQGERAILLRSPERIPQRQLCAGDPGEQITQPKIGIMTTTVTEYSVAALSTASSFATRSAYLAVKSRRIRCGSFSLICCSIILSSVAIKSFSRVGADFHCDATSAWLAINAVAHDRREA